jgi:hypothetical protein
MRRLGAAFALLLAGTAFTAADAPPRSGLTPPIEKAVKGERCVEDTATMRREHMRMLEHQRDATVLGGIRGSKHSLKGCIDCHAGASSGSVARTSTDFCVGCHRYAAVTIDCFECHSSKPQAVAAKRSAP